MGSVVALIVEAKAGGIDSTFHEADLPDSFDLEVLFSGF